MNLNKCPKCYSTNIEVKKSDITKMYWVECCDCKFYTKAKFTKHGAMKSWNLQEIN